MDNKTLFPVSEMGFCFLTYTYNYQATITKNRGDGQDKLHFLDYPNRTVF